MPFERPSLETIIKRVTADLESRLPTAQLRRSNAKVYAQVMAAVSHSLHGFIEYFARQLFFDTADGAYLDHWGTLFGLTRKPSSRARGRVTFSYTGEAVEVPAGTVLQSELGVQYKTTSAVSGGVAEVEALLAGESGNCVAGEEFTLVSPIVGVRSKATAGDIAGGADAEDDDALRARLLARVRERPHAGTAQDYEAWALEVAGVTRAWVYPREEGDGTVVIRFVCDGLDNIVPTATMIKTVQDYVDSVRPVTARVTVYAPKTEHVNFTIADLEPEDETVKKNIREALIELFQREAVPGKVLYLSHIRAAISGAVGEVNHVLVSPSADVKPATGILPIVGAITWQ